MRPVRKETAFERRLRELQDESSTLQRDIKSLSRSLKKLGADTETLPPPSPARSEAGRSRLNPNYAATIGADTTTMVTVNNHVPTAGEPETEVNLFTAEPPAASAPPPAVEPPAVLATRSDTASSATRYRRMAPAPKPDDSRFRSYFSNGSFARSVPLSHEKRVQRNKAIFAVCCLIVFGYILSRAFL